jgi:nucleoside-diphosphate-sugar epimerase
MLPGKIAVTGADGFIGVRLCDILELSGSEVLRVVRNREGAGKNRCEISDVSRYDEWSAALRGINTVVHLANTAHVLRRKVTQSHAAIFEANVTGTRKLAIGAAAAGVKRMVFVSSIGVNGDETNGKAFTETDSPQPKDDYARSKLAAELELKEIGNEAGLELVIVRPPLVYGPGAKGNFQRLIKLMNSGLPLPLAGIKNRRNVIGLDNLCGFLKLCIERSVAVGETFLIAEPQSRSTPEMLSALAAGAGKKARLLYVPEMLLRTVASITGYSAEFTKLCSCLEVDSSKAQILLGWRPIRSFDSQMREAAQWFVAHTST